MSAHILELGLRTDVPILQEGPPGVGKTKTVEHIARKMERPLVTVLASIREPSDFSGLPVITKDGSVRLAAPNWTEELGENGILHLDEMNSAPPAVQAALLRVCFDKVVGEKKLGKDVRIIASVNPAEYAANGNDLAPPLANRFMHIPFKLNPQSWINNFPDYWGYPPVISGVKEAEWAQKRGVLAAYISTKQHMLLQFPNEKNQHQRTGAWPSPRTWDFASRILAVTENGDELIQGFCGTVGEGAAMDFHTWFKNLDLPSSEEVLKLGKKFEIPSRADKTFAILSGVVSAIKNNPTEDRWKSGWTIIGKAIDKGHPDVAAVHGRHLVALNFQEKEKGGKVYQFPFPDELAKFEPIFAAAKIQV